VKGFYSVMAAMVMAGGSVAMAATPITVNNAGFESAFSAGDWVASSTGGAYAFGQYTFAGQFSPTHSSQAAYAYGDTSNGSGSSVTLTQTLSANYAAGNIYTLTVGVGDRNDMTLNPYRVQLWAGSTALIDSLSPVSPADGTFTTATLSSPASPSGSPSGALKIVLVALPTGDSSHQVVFDDVGLSFEAAAVPEPATFSLLGLVGLGFLSRRRHA
jgi:hypothetical protein